MTLRAHLLYEYDSTALDRLRGQLRPDVHLTVGTDPPQPADYQVLITGRPERAQLNASPNLQTLVIPWSGLPTQTRELMLEFPQVAVHNLHHNALPVAEMVLTLLLAAAKRIVPIDRTFRQHDWTPRYQPNPSILLEGKTALILGYGAIGTRVACMCRGLGMNVIGVRRQPAPPADDCPDEIQPAEALHQLLPRANALLICLPHTPATDGLIGQAELDLLPADALLVNVGRGEIVDQAALYAALRDGRLHGAGLDVWYNYPPDEASRAHTPPADYPFHELDNVIMSPHRAGGSQETHLLRMDHLARLLNAAAEGQEIPNSVDLDAGY